MIKAIAVMVVIALIATWAVISLTGSGGFERHMTLSGIYAVLRPEGFDVVCFADADSKDGGLACIPCSLANNCVKK